MKKLFLILCLACAVAVSCERQGPDSPKGSGQDSDEQVFWRVVGQLIDAKDITSVYDGGTFKPIIGTPDNGDESIRIVAVNSPEAAASRFNNLTGADITADTQSYTYKHKAVGSLTWNLGAGNTCWATVDVSIPSVPSLQKIIYRSAGQGDVNGSVGNDGSAYYRFGDVLRRVREEDGKEEYWICVRPAFGPEDKGKSHWVSVSPPPKSNIWPYYDTNRPFTASNNMEYGLPYNLRSDPEWYQDLAEMLFAICYPDAWFSNITSYSSVGTFGSPKGLPIFNDWHSNKISYHNNYFWKNVQSQWIKKDLVKKIFGITYQQLEQMVQPKSLGNSGAGLRFIYDSYSWNTIISNSPKLYQVHYYHGDKNEQKNMHLQTKTRPGAKVVTPNTYNETNTNFPLDIAKLTAQKPYLSEPRFFGDSEPRWMIRYAEGIELSENGRFNPQQPISGFSANDEVYRYYRDVVPDKYLTDAPEKTLSPDEQRIEDESKYKGNHGYFYPGCIVEDEEGSRWFCYSGWYSYNEFGDSFKTRDHYSRFISFDVKPATEGNEGYLSGKFYNHPDLLPEEEAPAALALLLVMCNTTPAQDGVRPEFSSIRDNVARYCKFNMNHTLVRDSTYTWTNAANTKTVKIRGSINSINVMIAPRDGRDEGEQPYMRLVEDGSQTGPERAQTGVSLYPYMYYYTTYNVPDNHPLSSNDMDLTDLFASSSELNSTIPADEWSRCAHHGTTDRDGGFSAADRYRVPFDASLFKTNPDQYRTAYHEPVLAVRFMKVDDPWVDRMPTVSVGGHRITDVYHPTTKEDVIMMLIMMNHNRMSQSEKDGYCFMNNNPYKVNFLQL